MYNYARVEAGTLDEAENKIEKKPKVSTEIRSDFADFEALEKAKQALFDRIEKETRDLSPEVRLALARRVIEHSIKDGVELATQLGASSLEITRILLGGSVDIKHKNANLMFGQKFFAWHKYTNLGDSEIISLDDLANRRRRESDLDLEDKWADSFPARPKSLAGEIDDYYAQFLAARKITTLDDNTVLKSRSGRLPNSVSNMPKSSEPTKTEAAGERVLNWLTEAGKTSYYTEPVKDIIWEELFATREKRDNLVMEKVLQDARIPEDLRNIFLYGSRISQPDLEQLLSGLGLKDKTGSLLATLKKAQWKPYGMMVKSEAGHARGVLTKELNAELTRRYGPGVKISLDENGKYAVEDRRVGTEIPAGPESPMSTPEAFAFDLGKFERNEIPYNNPVEVVKTLKTEKETRVLVRNARGVYYIFDSQDELSFFDGPFQQVDGLTEINGKLADRRALTNRDEWRVVFGDWISPEYKSVSNPVEIGGRCMFIAEMDSGRYVLSTEVGEYGWDYSYAGDLMEIDGKPAYVTSEGGWMSVVHGDKQGLKFPVIEKGSLISVAGKPTYIAVSNKGKKFVVSDRQLSFEYEDVKNLTNIADKTAYIALSGKNGRWKMIYDGQEQTQVQPDFAEIGLIKEIGGKLAFTAKTDNGLWSVIFDGRILNRQSDTIITELADISGKPAYVAKIIDKEHVYHENKQKVFGLEGDKISDLTEVAGELACRVTDKNGFSYVYYKDKKVKVNGSVESFTADEKNIFLVVKVSDRLVTYTYNLAGENVTPTNEREKIVLTEQEERDLELANLLLEVGNGKFDREAVTAYMDKYYPADKQMSLKDRLLNFVAHSKKVVGTLGQALKENPKPFLSTMGAKADNITEAYVEHLLYSLFPEIRVNKEKEERERWEKNGGRGVWPGFGHDRFDQAEADPDLTARAFLSGQEYTTFEGADPKNEREAEVVRLREPAEGMLVSGVFGHYNKDSKKWEKTVIKVTEADSGVTREVTMEITDTRGLGEVMLPRLTNGRILPDRVKGFDSAGREIDLTVTKNKFGDSFAAVPAGVKRVLYSQTEDRVPRVPTSCSSEEYEKFKKRNSRENGDGLTEKVSRLPDDLRLFLDSLRSRPPKEQLLAVETFVRRYGYYDFDNAEVLKEKRGKSLDEIISVMELRLLEIKRKKPEMAELLKNKKYAGVCADFALLGTAMLRELGIPSGVVAGFRLIPGEKSVTTKSAHGVSFALWPSADGGTEVIEMDGTPGGVTAEEEAFLASIRKPSLLEKEERIEAMSREVLAAAEKKFGEFEKVLADHDIEKIKAMSNGELERVLNILLAQVKDPHYRIIEAVLTAGRYAGFDVGALKGKNNVDEMLAFQKFLEGEVSRERKEIADGSDSGHLTGGKFSRGSELLDLVRDFADRYVKDKKGALARTSAFDILQTVVEVAQSKLDPLEKRATTAAIQYLEALKM